MFWALVLSLSSGSHTDEYVVDHFVSPGDCVSALRTTRNRQIYRNVRVSLACEKTRLVRK